MELSSTDAARIKAYMEHILLEGEDKHEFEDVCQYARATLKILEDL